ncbi:FtsX-like permease family protein [Streptosporangium sp. NPDC000396]|uniref:FtsX-like permease family protein n=1 Tax=Streptosporangium sp. NPDC000396 TaxID=3366185 RepID=UPI0036B68B70
MRIGTFVALALGVLLLGTTGLVLTAAIAGGNGNPGRYTKAPAVVVADVGHVEMSGGVADRTFYAQVVGGPASSIGRPWGAAPYSGYRLVAGHAPAKSNEIVTATGSPGRRVTVLTANGSGEYTVSGVTAPVGFESAVFFTDAEAARLSPRVDAVIFPEAPASVPAGLTVLTGDDRALADPKARRDATTLVGLTTIMGMATAVAAFVSVFVVASTFAFSVTQRRRELALQRIAGATPSQITRLVLREAARTGVAASAVGCACTLVSAPVFAHFLASIGLAPTWFTVAPSPLSVLVLLVAFGVGVGLAVVGATAAAVRAGQIRPVEALRDAELDRRPMTPFRWLGGTLALLAAAGLTVLALVLPDVYGSALATYVGPTLIVALALLSPVFIAFFTRLLPPGLLSRANTLASVRHAAAVSAPVLLTVGLLSCLWTSPAVPPSVTFGDSVILPAGTPGLNRTVVERVSGSDALVLFDTTVHAVPRAGLFYGPAPESVPFDARAVNRADLLGLPVLSGRLADLDDSSIVVDETWGYAVGDRVRIQVADGSFVTLRVAAVTALDSSGGGALLTPRHLGPALASAIFVRGELPALDGLPVSAVPIGKWTAASDAYRAEQLRLALLIVGGVAVLYAGVSVANTLAMSTRKFTVYRAAGATSGQVLRMVSGEALIAVGIGGLLAGLASGAHWLAFAFSSPFPLVPFLSGLAACSVVAVVAAVLSARVRFRA